MTEIATHLTVERVRAQIDEMLDALVQERSDELIQKLQALVSAEHRLERGLGPFVEIDWL